MKNLNLGKDNINKLLITFSVPCVISLLINSIYNIVDQIFIGKGVGILGNAATNTIFPLIIIFNALASLIGNGASANLSLKLGEGKKEEAKRVVGSSVTVLFIASVILSIIFYFTLPKLVYLFGCTENVYDYALTYGRIILLGAPFVITYSGLSSIIRADGSPEYAMKLLVTGAIINLILDPLFIFTFHMGVKGGAIATVIGQIVSFLMAILYLCHFKSIKLKIKDFIPNKSIIKALTLGLSSFITQGTILALFIFMNNIMTKYGGMSKFGSDIPLSCYGVISKLNSIYICSILGISIGAQPIIGFNYGARNYDRVKETLKKVLLVNFIIGICFNLLIVLFPKFLVGIFISKNDANYTLFMEFAVLVCRSLFLVCSLNALEMTTSIVLQSLGRVFKSTFVSFARQIILFIPIASILCITFKKGIYGALYAGIIADVICFIMCIFLFTNELKGLSKKEEGKINDDGEYQNKDYNGKRIVITISREYGSGGRYVGKLLAEKLGVNFYDKIIIKNVAKKTGLAQDYILENDQTIKNNYGNNNDDLIFIAETKVIKDLAKTSCVIVGRCADYILKDDENAIHIFLYSDIKSKIKRITNYYNIKKSSALKEITMIDKNRSKHYKHYTNREWKDPSNYDLMINVDKYGVEKTVEIIVAMVEKNI